MGVTEDQAESWFGRRTSHWGTGRWSDCWKASQGARVSVVIPARDEEATVGGVVGAIARAFIRQQPLVDELVVMDYDSTDGTAEAAARGRDRLPVP